MPLSQKMDVYVESTLIASTEKVWLQLNGYESNSQVSYLIPRASIDSKCVLESENTSFLRNEHQVTTMRLSIVYPYRIEIATIGWLFTEISHDTTQLVNMVIFDERQVNFRLYPK